MNKKQAKLDEALALLQSRVADGMEFPDACWHAADKFSVTVDELRDAYDAQCLETEAPVAEIEPISRNKFEIKQQEPEGWLKAFQVLRDGEHASYFHFRDDADDYIADAVKAIAPTDPVHEIAQAAGYSVFKYTATDGGQFTWSDGKQDGFECTSAFEAWTTATNRYLAGLAPVDSENKIDMLKALEQKRILQLPNPHGDEPMFLVLKSVHVDPVSKLILATGWMVDGLGAKLETSYPNPVSLSSDSWKMPSESMARDIVDDNSPPRLGKGTLNCQVKGEGGEVLREVSMKARFDTVNLVVKVCSPPTVVAPVPESEWRDFDPLTQPDPVTGQRYTGFEYIDDVGKVFAVNPVTMRPDFEVVIDGITAENVLQFESESRRKQFSTEPASLEM